MPTKKLYPCMLCEKRYAEIEEAEVCERSHEPKADGETFRGKEAASYHLEQQAKLQREFKR